MFAQTGFIIGLQVLGILWGLALKKWLDVRLMAVSGFLWGALTWILLSLPVAILFDSAYTATTMFSLIAVTGIILLFVAIREQPSQTELAWSFGTLVIFSLFTMIFVLNNFAILSYDSYTLVLLGQQIGFFEEINLNISTSLASWGVFMPLLHAASVFLDIDYLYALQPMFAISGLASIFYFIYHSLGKQNQKIGIRILVSCLAITGISSTYFLVFESVYIHNNLLSAIYLFLFVALAWNSLQDQSSSMLFLGLVALSGFVLLRTETSLTAVIFLFLLISYYSSDRDKQVKQLGIIAFSIFVFIWYLYLFLAIGTGTDILSPSKIVILVIPYIGLLVVIWLSKRKEWEKRLPHIPLLLLYVFLVGALIVGLLKPEHMATSLTVMVKNMFDFNFERWEITWYGRWGITWFVFVILGLLALAWPKINHEKFLSYGIILFLILIYLFAFARNPYRLGFGDSANRMLTHIVPIIVFYFSLKFGQTKNGVNSNKK
jgi:hypothetical protein